MLYYFYFKFSIHTGYPQKVDDDDKKLPRPRFLASCLICLFDFSCVLACTYILSRERELALIYSFVIMHSANQIHTSNRALFLAAGRRIRKKSRP